VERGWVGGSVGLGGGEKVGVGDGTLVSPHSLCFMVAKRRGPSPTEGLRRAALRGHRVRYMCGRKSQRRRWLGELY